MGSFSYLLISDLHLKSSLETWSQKVVLRDMIRDIETRKDGFQNVQFIVVSGDLAFSGRPEEYALVEAFLDDLRQLFGLERNRVFFVAGNHDINRGVQTTCYAGARHLFDSPQEVERFLHTPDERNTLLRRLAGFLDFDSRYCESHDRHFTGDGLAYVAPFELDGLPICIAGLNSAWLCGGDDDMRQIVVGDCPIIDVVEMMRTHSPRLVIGVLHHPPDWLRDFDQRAIEERFLPECDLLHRGHLHEPNVRIVSNLSGHDCIVVAAGAGYAGRDFDNCYSLINIEPRTSSCETSTFIYDGRAGSFSAIEPVTIPIQLRGDIPGTMADLADAIAKLAESAESLSSYLASLLDGSTSEVAIRVDGRILFASPALLSEEDDAELSQATQSFLEVRNLLLSFSDATPLTERVTATTGPIVRYCDLLYGLAQSDEGERDMQLLAFAFDQLADTELSDEYRKLLRTLVHDSILPQHDRLNSPGRDAAFEVYVGAICTAARLIPVTWEEPDVTCVLDGTKYAFAAKRIKSLASLEKRVKKAVVQIKRSRMPGVIVLDVGLAFNPDNHRIRKMADTAFLVEYKVNFNVTWAEYQPKVQAFMARADVLRIIVHDYHVRQQLNEWQLSGITIRVPAEKLSKLDQQRFEKISMLYTYGLPNQSDRECATLLLP